MGTTTDSRANLGRKSHKTSAARIGNEIVWVLFMVTIIIASAMYNNIERATCPDYAKIAESAWFYEASDDDEMWS